MSELAMMLGGAALFILGGIVGYLEGRKSADPMKSLPYRWECHHDGCVYKCSAENMNVLLAMADEHCMGHDD